MAASSREWRGVDKRCDVVYYYTFTLHRTSPMPNKVRDTVKVSCFIDRATFEAFGRLYPGYGATAFLVESSMREILRQTEGDPSAVERVRQAIRDTMRSHRPLTQRPSA